MTVAKATADREIRALSADELDHVTGAWGPALVGAFIFGLIMGTSGDAEGAPVKGSAPGDYPTGGPKNIG